MPAAVPVVMVVVPVESAHVGFRRGHCDSGECDCRECGDYLDLVHDVVPFFISRKPILALTPG